MKNTCKFPNKGKKGYNKRKTKMRTTLLEPSQLHFLCFRNKVLVRYLLCYDSSLFHCPWPECTNLLLHFSLAPNRKTRPFSWWFMCYYICLERTWRSTEKQITDWIEIICSIYSNNCINHRIFTLHKFKCCHLFMHLVNQ